MSDFAVHSSNGSQITLDALAGSTMLAVDVEGSGLHIGKDIPYGYAITSDPSSSFYASVHSSFFGSLLADDSKLKIAHNAKYDRSMLKKAGIIADNWCDPMIAAHLLEDLSLSLQFLAGVYLHKDITAFEQLEKRLEAMPLQELADYAGPHAETTFALWLVLCNRLKRLGLLGVFWNIEMPFVPVISDMELNGIAVDTNTLDTLGADFDQKIAMLEKGLDYWSGHPRMNHNSPDQVASLLYDELNLPVGRTTKSGDRPSVDKRYLITIKDKHPYIPMYLFYKELKTLKHSYVDSLRRDVVNGRIYCSFNQTRTSTGRLSSSGPNLQKIPTRTVIGRQIRTAFVAPPGYKLVKPDYNQIELRMMAHQSQDPALLGAFGAGRDVHEETAVRAYRDAKRRPNGKTLNFKLIYLGGTRAEQDMLFSIYPRVREWSRETGILLRQNLYARTLGGRIRTIEELEMYNPSSVIAHGVREGISTMIQGCVSGGTKILVKGKGYVDIKSMAGHGVTIWDGTSYVGARVVYSGKKKEVIVDFWDGRRLCCSIDHKFATVNTAGGRHWKSPAVFPKTIYVENTSEAGDPCGITTIPAVLSKGTWNAKNISFSDIKSAYSLGVVLGRLASDGSISEEHSVGWIVAEHEYDAVLDYLKGILSVLGKVGVKTQQKKNEEVTTLIVNSRALAVQASGLSMYEHIPPGIFANKEILRGFLCGFFDGDSGLSGKALNLNQSIAKEGLMRDIQEALLLFGIRSRLHLYGNVVRISISTKSNRKFREEIGFIDPKKLSALDYSSPTTNKLGSIERVKTVTFTEHYVDMYDVLNSESERYMAAGLVVHNSSAEEVKKGMVRAYREFKGSDIKVVLQVHDEAVYQVPDSQVNDALDVIWRTFPTNELSIPLTVDVSVGDDWGTMEKVKEGEKYVCTK